MYPQLSDLFEAIFGVSVCFPAQTFGFFVALAFLAAYQVLRLEMIRREKAGEFVLENVKVQIKGPIPMTDVWVQAGIWALIGYKLGLGFENWCEFSNNPQNYILTPDGSFLWAVVFGGIAGGWKFFQYNKSKDQKVEFKEEKAGPSQYLGKVLIMAFVAGLLGAKIFHNLEYFDDFLKDPLGALVSFDGLTFYGGLLTAGFLISRFLWKKGYNLLHMLDIFVPCLILAYAIGRMGCQMAGDGDWGIENPAEPPAWLTWLPEWLWHFDYPHNVAKEGIRIAGCEGDYCYRLETPVFPTPLYETTMGLTIFGILWFLRKRLKLWGQLTGIYLFLNGLERFLIEKIRVNSTYDIAGLEITQAEIISSCLMLAGIFIFVFVTFVRKKNPASEKSISAELIKGKTETKKASPEK